MLRHLFPTLARSETRDADLDPQMAERISSAIGISLAVLIVVGVAVLMGMA